jgi:outer membrane biogenesis lipoprotein LolB
MTRAYRSLTWAVAALLLTACAAMAAQENAAPREWQSLDLGGLAALANELQAKGDTRSSTAVAAWVLSR